MRLIDWSFILVVFLTSNTFSQQEKDDKRPSLFDGGLIQRIEIFREKVKLGQLEPQNRIERPKGNQEETRESPKERSKTVGNTLSQPFLPLDGSLSSRRKSSQNTNSQGVPGIDPVPQVSQNKVSQNKVNLGLKVRPGGLGTNGLLIEKIERSSPAERAGLRIRDRITSVGGSPVKNIDEFNLIMRAFEAGDRTEFEFVRSGKKGKVLVEFPASAQARSIPLNKTERPLGTPTLPPILPLIQQDPREVRAGMGVTAVAVDPVLFTRDQLSVRQGAYLDEISKGSAAEKAGLTTGDVVIAVDGRKVDSAVRMAFLIQTYKPGDKAQVLYYRKNRLKRTEIQMDAVPATESTFSPGDRGQFPLGQTGSAENPQPKRGSILGDLGDDFPRLKKVEKMIDRFSNGPRPENQPGPVEMTKSKREAVLEHEVRSLRDRVKRQERQIKDLSEKLNLIESLLRKRE